MELSMLDYDLAHILPSKIGAAALCLTLDLSCGDDSWVSDSYICFKSKLRSIKLGVGNVFSSTGRKNLVFAAGAFQISDLPDPVYGSSSVMTF